MRYSFVVYRCNALVFICAVSVICGKFLYVFCASVVNCILLEFDVWNLPLGQLWVLLFSPR